VEPARIVQITDSHFSATAGVPPQWPALLDWLRADPPDLVVHTGDIVFENPDDDADRAFARGLLDSVPAPLAIIPGNHDIGFFGDDADRPRRLATFRDTWGDDRFSLDLAGWRVVGADVYLLGTDDHDTWLRRAVATEQPVITFVHQPLDDPERDGWEMPATAVDAFEAATATADVRVVASGHRHTSRSAGRAVWAPSLTLTGNADHGDDPRPGVVEHVIGADGSHAHRVVRPWDGVT
jgi:3',5'-cyclic AMP phosphodiesterase CpdA